MANYELVFDLGSQYISAGLKSDGFIDKIPSVVAYGESKQISAVGLDAVNLSRTNPSVKLAHPILEGAAIDSDGVKALASALIKRLISQRINVFNRFLVTCTVPCGMISGDKKNIESIFLALGARQVTFVETPVADSVKLFAEFRARHGLVVNLGCECADFAVVYGGGLKVDNAEMLASIDEIDGGLIALTRFQGEIGFYPDEYLEIIKTYLGK